MKNIALKCICFLFACLIVSCSNEEDYISLVVDCNTGIRDFGRSCEQMKNDFGSGCVVYKKGTKEYAELLASIELFRDDSMNFEQIDAIAYIEIFENGILANTICMENSGLAFVSAKGKYQTNDSLLSYAFRHYCK